MSAWPLTLSIINMTVNMDILIISLMFGSAMCIRVLKMSDDVLPEHDVRAEILNTASIKDLDALTICGRLWSPFRPHMTQRP